MNTPSITTATKVWRWNASGLGYSKNGYNGNYGLAMTIDGGIGADYITTGSLTANIIKAGILTDLKGKFTLDMINGTLTMKDGTFSGTINASTITGGTVSGTTINGGTITGTTIQNAATGSRVLMDSSSSLKGYYNNTLHNIINMSNRNNTNNDLIIDADHQLHIRTPKVYVSDQSYGTGGGTVYETRNGQVELVYDVGKRQSTELWVANAGEDEGEVYCMLPALLQVNYAKYDLKHGMWLTGSTTRSDTI
jgi:phage-related protein